VRQVEQQHSRFIQAIQASPNGVAMLDDHDQIEWCNAIAEVHFGVDAKRDLRQRITNLVRHPEFVRYLNGQHYDETLVMRGMGESRQNVLEVQVFPYGENRKLLLTQDITELERTEAMRRDFVANVSHELKTPLTVLSGFLETMRELPLNEDDRARYLDLMEQQASRMQHIVTDLLVLAKLEGESRPPTDHAVDMRALFDHLKEDAQTLSNGHHDITFSIDETLGVTGAQTEVFSAFANLVTNACAIRRTAARSPCRGGARAARRVFGHRQRLRHSGGRPAAPDRALLPRRPQPLARHGRHGAGPGDRQARAAASRLAPVRAERGRARQHVHRAVPGVARDRDPARGVRGVTRAPRRCIGGGPE
jgi:two-component system phosphate regulon sensor histidine kinase PhoR